MLDPPNIDCTFMKNHWDTNVLAELALFEFDTAIVPNFINTNKMQLDSSMSSRISKTGYYTCFCEKVYEDRQADL